MHALTPGNIVDVIARVFETRGGEAYLGEPVTISQHMLQCATIAERQGLRDEVVVGALLHDIGHITGDGGMFSMDDTLDRRHEAAGAAMLEPFLPAVIVACVRHHVAAKRYLCATRPGYFDRLSEASVHSLILQGGPMGAGEVSVFEGNPHLDEIIAVRRLDESGKRPDLETPGFRHFAPLVQRMVESHAAMST